MLKLQILVKLVEWAFPDFRFQWLVDEMKRNVPLELNFKNEGLNSEKAAAAFQHFPWLKVSIIRAKRLQSLEVEARTHHSCSQVPNVYWEYSSPRVLTMEFVTGGQVNDLKYIQEHNINPYEVSHLLGHLYSQMIFVKGFIHSDPHPGNILVRQNNDKLQVILLDHGLYAVSFVFVLWLSCSYEPENFVIEIEPRFLLIFLSQNLSDKFRGEYSKLWLSIMNRDEKGMKIHSENMGVGQLWPLFACMVSGRTWQSITTGIETKKFDDLEVTTSQSAIA